MKVQSVDPHWQSVPAVLEVAPLVTAQIVGGRFEQVLVEAVQYIPVAGVQSEEPHEQGLCLRLVMSLSSQNS